MITRMDSKPSVHDVVEIEVRDLDEPTLTPAQVADIFRVDVKTVTRWAQAGRLTSFRTLGGHRRFRRAEVLELKRRRDAGQ
jgi:excisionase family DNA binding protein